MSNMWLTPAQAAELAQVSLTLLYSAINRGELRHSRIPPGQRSIRIQPDAVRDWLFKFEQSASA